MVAFSLFHLLVASVLQSATEAALQPDALVVSTNVGTFQGVYSSPSVRSWLGIRYGLPTNGTRRFRPPQRALILPKTEIFNATEFSPSCPNVGQVGGRETMFSDDCLSLNIWSPALNRTTNQTDGAAVMIWIYGGGYNSGMSNEPSIFGNNFVRDQENIIVVSINYRISIYGFPAGSGARPTDSNGGLQDQRMAIEWVYNNIHHFGGNPSKITLFGQSAGASSIGSYAYTYASDPIARALILESGSEFLNDAITVSSNNSASIVAWNSIAATIGCNATSSSTRFACMQRANLSILSSAVKNYRQSRTAFLPVVDGVHMESAADYDQLSLAGKFAHIPLLLGTNNNEGTSLVSAYGGGDPSVAGTITETSFTCPAAHVAEARHNASVPVWQYRYFGTWPNISPPAANMGAYHSSEIPLVFGTYNQSTSQPISKAEIMTSAVMQSAWAAFAQNPTTGLTAHGWPRYVANGTTLIQLAFDYYNQTQAVLDAAKFPIVTLNATQAYNGQCPSSP